MISRNITVRICVGLHARPATFFIQKANSYKCSIWVEKDDRRVTQKVYWAFFPSALRRILR